MNPEITEAGRLARIRRRDPERARREFDADWVDALDTFLAGVWVDSAVINGRFELPPRPNIWYICAVDPSGGGKDAFTLCIMHLEVDSDGTVYVVVDCLKSWRSGRSGPVDLEGIVRDISNTIRIYGQTAVTGDAYAKNWVVQAFARAGITYVQAPPKAEAYLELEPFFAQGRIDLLDHPVCIRELKLLERQQRPGGKVRVDHPKGAHDDHANVLALAVCTAVQLLAVSEATPTQEIGPEERASLRAWQRSVGWEPEPPGGYANLALDDDGQPIDRRYRWLYG